MVFGVEVAIIAYFEVLKQCYKVLSNVCEYVLVDVMVLVAPRIGTVEYKVVSELLGYFDEVSVLDLRLAVSSQQLQSVLVGVVLYVLHLIFVL